MRRNLLFFVSIPILLVLLATGLIYAQGPEPGQEVSRLGDAGRQVAPGPQAALGEGFTYQGQLKDDAGSPIDDTCDFTFGLWDAESGGTQVGADSAVSGVTVAGGYFAAVVNDGGEFGADAFAGEARWLEITVQCTGDTTPVVLSPRQLLSGAPYAHYSVGAPWEGIADMPAGFADDVDDDVLGGLSCANGQIAEWDGSAWVCGDDDVGAGGAGDISAVYAGDGLIGGGISGDVTVTVDFAGSGSATTVSHSDHDHWGESWSGSGTGLTLSGGNIGLSGSGSDYGLYGTCNSTSGSAVSGYASATSGFTHGVYGWTDSAAGHGVRGWATAGSGETFGVSGQSDSPSGTGVYGRATAGSGETFGVYGRSNSTAGYGVYGLADATSGETFGVYGRSNSTAGRGVYGYAAATSGETFGVYGQSDSLYGYGVFGRNTTTSGQTFGVVGVSVSPEGSGVYGWAGTSSGTNNGVFGRADSTDGRGVYGWALATSGTTYGVYGVADSTDGRGVAGHATATSGLAFGVLGRSDSAGGYGVYYVGGIAGTGLQSTIVETSRDGWHHLYNGASTTPLFEEVGTAQLADGQAVVTIDPLFAQTVNLEESYQVFLTPLGDCGLYVAEKTPSSFTVHVLDGKSCSIAFDYRIVAKRLGYEDTRLAPAEDPAIAAQGPAQEVQP